MFLPACVRAFSWDDQNDEAMNKEQKAAAIEAIAGQVREADAVLAVDYRGISVAQAAELRAKLREADTTFRIVKNSLTLRALEQAGADELKPWVDGPTAFAFVRGDAATAAKALNDFARVAKVLEAARRPDGRRSRSTPRP